MEHALPVSSTLIPESVPPPSRQLGRCSTTTSASRRVGWRAGTPGDQRTPSGRRGPVAGIRSTCSRRRATRGRPSSSRSATAAWRSRRSPSSVAAPRSWRWTWRRRRSPGCGSRRAATPTSPTSASSPRPSATSCSTSTTSTRRCPGPWEWDVKRLAASLHVVARGQRPRPASCERGASPDDGADLPRAHGGRSAAGHARALVRPHPRRRRRSTTSRRRYRAGDRTRRAQGRAQGPRPGRRQADPSIDGLGLPVRRGPAAAGPPRPTPTSRWTTSSR